MNVIRAKDGPDITLMAMMESYPDMKTPLTEFRKIVLDLRTDADVIDLLFSVTLKMPEYPQMMPYFIQNPSEVDRSGVKLEPFYNQMLAQANASEENCRNTRRELRRLID